MKHRLKKIVFESLDKNKLNFNIKNELSFRVSQLINEKMLFEQNNRKKTKSSILYQELKAKIDDYEKVGGPTRI